MFSIVVDYLTNNLDISTFMGINKLLLYIYFQLINLFSAVYSCGFLCNIIFHLLYRIILIFEELKHVKSRYENSYKTIFTDALVFPLNTIAAGILCLFIIYLNGFKNTFPLNINVNFLLCFAPSVFLLGKIFKLVSHYQNKTTLVLLQSVFLEFFST